MSKAVEGGRRKAEGGGLAVGAFDPTRRASVSGPALASQTADVVLPSETAELRDQGELEKPIAIAIGFDLSHWRGGYVSSQLDDPRISSSRISPEQGIALKLLTCSLKEQGARMANDRYVQTAPDALKYLLDQVVAQIPDEQMAELLADAV